MKAWLRTHRLTVVIFTVAFAVSAVMFGLTWAGSLWTQENIQKTEMSIRQWNLGRIILGDHQNQALYLAQRPLVREFLQFPTAAGRKALEIPLNTVKDVTGASLVYLMDAAGMVRAAAYDQLLGESFAFRPYFREAREGRPGIQLAEGSITKERGIYFSVPVTGKENQVTGAVVIKHNLNIVDSYLQKSLTYPAFLVSSEGIIFAGNREAYFLKSLRPLDPETRQRLKAEKAAGHEIQTANIKFQDPTVRFENQDHLYLETPLPGFEGLKLVTFYPIQWPWGLWAATTGGIWLVFWVLLLIVQGIHRARTAKALAQQARERSLQDALIRENEKRFREYFDEAPVGMLSVSPDRSWWMANRKYLEIMGRTAEELRPMNWEDFTHPEDIPKEIPLMRELEAGKLDHFHLDKRILNRDGTYKVVALHMRALWNEGKIQLFHVMLLDISGRVKAEEEIRQNQKMAALGQMAGGIAHEFNNLIGGILGYSELLIMLGDGQPDTHEYATGIASAARRARELTRKLLSFSRKNPLTFEALDLVQLTQETLSLLKLSLHRKIQLDFEAPRDELLVWADSQSLQSAILNLGLNALDAMPQGGSLVFSLRREGLEVLLEVRDTGVGMPPEILSRIYEPFFTTKPHGKGTGLGLSMVYGTVQDHLGQMEVDSVPGQGTRFLLRFPGYQGTKGETQDVQNLKGQFQGLVLLVDDENALLKPTAALLRVLGLEVLEATSGEEALALAAQDPRPLAAALIDRQMPGISGVETWQRLRGSRPDTPVIIMSGFAEQEEVQGWMDQGLCAFLQKPFDRRSLVEALQKLGLSH